LDAVIANGVTTNGKKYALVPSFPDLYKASNDNNSESIFAVQAAANTGSVNNANSDGDLNWPYNTGPNGPGNCCGFFQPSFELGNSYRTRNGLPLLDGSYNTPANAVKTDMNIQSGTAFTPDAGELDPRIDHTIGRRGIMFLDWQKHPGRREQVQTRTEQANRPKPSTVTRQQNFSLSSTGVLDNRVKPHHARKGKSPPQ
jgi:hypothetical protein